jgi:mannose-6-phosphate isomerase-like protein (cupin superfamily)
MTRKDTDMDIRPLDRDSMPFENGAFGQRLVPWDVMNAPFEGAYVVVPARGATGAHEHHEAEIFIGVRGEAEIESGGERHAFRAGDIEHHAPGVLHRVINDGDEDFEFYAIWWDTEMSHKFLANHVDDYEGDN